MSLFLFLTFPEKRTHSQDTLAPTSSPPTAPDPLASGDTNPSEDISADPEPGSPPEPVESPSAEEKAPKEKEVMPENLPDIEAKIHSVSILRQSRSGRVYLVKADASDPLKSPGLPSPGKIILFKKSGQSVMGFRVLKNYPERSTFAARKVKEYGGYSKLERGTSYVAVEKLADIAIPVYSRKDADLDKVDLKELEEWMQPALVPEYDPALDAGSSPAPGDKTSNIYRKQKNLVDKIQTIEGNEDSDEDDSDEEDSGILAPEEMAPLDPDHHWLSLQFGFLANSKQDGTTAYFASGGIRYGLTLGKNLFYEGKQPQDSLVAEAGVFYYTALGYILDSDSYTVAPILLTLRYNILFNQTFGFFGYAGLIKNVVVTSTLSTTKGISALSKTGPALGLGVLFNVGPKWMVRADIGLDMIGAGLVLRF